MHLSIDDHELRLRKPGTFIRFFLCYSDGRPLKSPLHLLVFLLLQRCFEIHNLQNTEFSLEGKQQLYRALLPH